MVIEMVCDLLGRTKKVTEAETRGHGGRNAVIVVRPHLRADDGGGDIEPTFRFSRTCSENRQYVVLIAAAKCRAVRDTAGSWPGLKTSKPRADTRR